MSDMAYAVHTRSCTYLLDDDGICRWTLAPTGTPVPGADRYLGAQFVACLDVREEGGLVGELRIGAAALFARSEGGRLVLLRTPLIEFVEHRPDDEDDASAVAEPSPPEPRESLPSYTPYVEPAPAYAPRPTAAPPAYAAHEHRAREYSAPEYAAPEYSAPAYAAPAYAAPAYSAPEPTAPAYSAPEPRAPAYSSPEKTAPFPTPTYAAPAYAAPAYAAPASVATAPLPLPVAPPRMFPAPRAPLPPTPAFASEPDIDLDEELDVEELATFSEVTLTIPLYRPEKQRAPPPPLPPRRGVVGPGRRLR